MKQLLQGNLQASGDLLQAFNGQVLLAPLNLPNVVGVQTRTLPKLLLTQTLVQTKNTNSFSQCFRQRM